jgi:SpoIID/LytB domain protein
MKVKDKKTIYLSTMIIFIFVLANSVFSLKVHAYSNPALAQDLKVGLVTMTNSALTATFSGNYTLNSTQIPAGTTLNIKLINGMININNNNYTVAQFIPLSQNSFITLTSGTSTYKYRGAFLLKVMSDKILPINIIDMDNYLKGVVGYEMSDFFPIEALKAQAVAARNFALSKIGAESAKGYDFDDTTSYQVYKGYDDRLKNTIRAVEETRGMVLLYNNSLVEALYSASHGGYTEDSVNVWGNPVTYLKSKVDIFDSELWPKGNINFTGNQIDSILKSKGLILSTDTFLSLDLSSITKYPSGRVSNININYRDISGVAKVKSITKDRARTFLSLPSSMYTVSYDSTTGLYTFSGKGNGHGLGMSQIGAKNRAASGQSFDEILKFYYEGSYLVKDSYSNSLDYSYIAQLAEDNKVNIILKSALGVLSDKIASTK